MSSIESREPKDRFIEAWREWAARPPRQSPAEAAAAVSRRLPSRRQQHSWWPLAAAAAATVAVVLAISWSVLVRPDGPPGSTVDLPESTPMNSGEVLIWLDEQTPLYMTFQPPGDGQASGNKL